MEIINQDVQKSINYEKKVDFISLFAKTNKNKNENKNEKLSITAEYSQLDYKFINANMENVEFKNFYFGLHPMFDEEAIYDIIVKRKIKNIDDFEEYINKNGNLFAMYDSCREYIKPLYKKTILQAASRFSFQCSAENNLVFDNLKDIFAKLNNINIKFENETLRIYLMGIISDEVTKIFNMNGYYFNIVNDPSINKEKVIISKNKRDVFKFTSEEAMRKHIKLHYKTKSFYSGVIMKLMRIEESNNDFANNNVKSLILKVHRTTFFTEDSFDNKHEENSILLSEKDKVKIEEFFSKEHQKQEEIYNKKNLSMNDVNDYLRVSNFTNIIGVTANLITSDDMYVMCKRGEFVEDRGSLYPSANGHVEFNDMNVGFYKKSVYEDMPIIKAEENVRLNFEPEIEREIVAELNVENYLNKWEYIGISVLGMKTINKDKRRFHFNILLKNKISCKSTELVELQKNAVEDYENDRLYLIKLQYFSNIFSFLWKKIYRFFELASKSKNLITIFSTFVTILLTRNFFLFEKNLKSLICDKPLEATILFFSFIITIKSWWIFMQEKIKYYNNLKTINQIKTISISDDWKKILAKTEKKINKVEMKLNKNGIKKNDEKDDPKIYIHPITLLMYRVYIEEKCEKQKKK